MKKKKIIILVVLAVIAAIFVSVVSAVYFGCKISTLSDKKALENYIFELDYAFFSEENSFFTLEDDDKTLVKQKIIETTNENGNKMKVSVTFTHNKKYKASDTAKISDSFARVSDDDALEKGKVYRRYTLTVSNTLDSISIVEVNCVGHALLAREELVSLLSS